MAKYTISVVSYLNSLPFIYGIENYLENLQDFNLISDIPSVSAKKIKDNKFDIGLVPIAILPSLTNYKRVSDYCIGTEGVVDSVLLLSNSEIKDVKSIILDYHSRTSVNLVKILAQNYWKINPEYIAGTENFEDNIPENSAALIIGDRAFIYRNKYKYSYDLATEWKKLTGLPFVFAVWVALKSINGSIIENINKAFNKAFKNTNNISLPANSVLNKEQFTDYITNKISYNISLEKQKAIELYLKFIKEF